jgi:rhomboid family GlyGly-CTERM serine protease
LARVNARQCGQLGIIRAVIPLNRIVRALSLSNAERWALALAIGMVALQFAPGEALEYRREWLLVQPWRALSGHLVHVNWLHAAINAGALVLLAGLFEQELTARRQWLTLVSAALTISAALALLWPGIEWYRGASGALHALYFAGAGLWLLRTQPRGLKTLWLPLLLVLGGWIKVVTEQPAGGATPFAPWLGATIVPQAHLVGALWGTLLGVWFAALDAYRRRQRDEQQMPER